MQTLYPPAEPYVRYTLKVEAPHALYVEECGNPADQAFALHRAWPKATDYFAGQLS